MAQQACDKHNLYSSSTLSYWYSCFLRNTHYLSNRYKKSRWEEISIVRPIEYKKINIRGLANLKKGWRCKFQKFDTVDGLLSHEQKIRAYTVAQDKDV